MTDITNYLTVLHVWEEVKPLGQGPCPRRRQSCCVVGSKMFLFGGTRQLNYTWSLGMYIKRYLKMYLNIENKYYFLSLFSSPKENYDEILEEDPNGEEQTDRRLKDHNDLHVLDFGEYLLGLETFFRNEIVKKLVWYSLEIYLNFCWCIFYYLNSAKQQQVMYGQRGKMALHCIFHIIQRSFC